MRAFGYLYQPPYQALASTSANPKGRNSMQYMVDRLDPDQVRALRAEARQLLHPSVGQPGSRSSTRWRQGP
jgi:hypothetical protein